MTNSIRDALVNAAVQADLDGLADTLQARAEQSRTAYARSVPVNANAEGLVVKFARHHNPNKSILESPPDVSTIKVSVLEDEYSVVFTLEGDDELDIHSESKLFFVLREALVASKGKGYFLMVKFAKRITDKPHPCLQDPATLTLYFDPLMPFRDSLEAFTATRTLTLLKVPSASEFYRKLDRKRFDHSKKV